METYDSGRMPALIDLHTHSHHSDGTLTPTALAQAAAARGVRLLALTDHDSTAGLDECASACQQLGVEAVTGVEVTSLWRGQEIHVVGLGIEAARPGLVAHLSEVVRRRRLRIATILERLRRSARVPGGSDFGEGLEALPVPTRTHVARELIARGAAGSTQEAFDRWLARGRPGHAPADWPALADAVAAIRGAGGHAVLAHPHRYKLSSGGRRALIEEFVRGGGAALELDLPGLSPSDAAQLAVLARTHGLAGSAGSDFHEPGQAWRPLGRFAKLPEGIEPLWTRFAQTPVG
jgi:3',5'-nucleoside bisphosphate phosphatase